MSVCLCDNDARKEEEQRVVSYRRFSYLLCSLQTYKHTHILVQMSRAVSLYRSLLRASAEFKDYSLRQYATRRVKTDFRANATLAASEAEAAMVEGERQLAA